MDVHSDRQYAEDAVAKLKLPHPYLTTYLAIPADRPAREGQWLQVLLEPSKSQAELPEPLHNDELIYLSLQQPLDGLPPLSNNTTWARARRSPGTEIEWQSAIPPTQAQIWLVIYLILTQQPETETFRLRLQGIKSQDIEKNLIASGLAVPYPKQESADGVSSVTGRDGELLVLRGTFWQGAGSPFGLRSIWLPDSSQHPPETLDQVLTTRFPDEKIHAYHPRRPSKPIPGSVIYSRYIPSLDEYFSMLALDYRNPSHLNLFHTWQNDPRVAQGWNETGALDEHRRYLERLHEDPHVVTVLAKFEDVAFAYFEIYWAAEDHLGAYYKAAAYDRGRHALVGNPNFRGRYRVTAWWSATMHYIFLDDARTDRIVGEPKFSNSSVLAYDLMHGFSMAKYVDLPHKRSALMLCSRERFFQLCPLDHEGGFVGGTKIPLPAKL